jgi:hypothetical protein
MYNCECCGHPSQSGQPMKRYTKYRETPRVVTPTHKVPCGLGRFRQVYGEPLTVVDKQIVQETPVCPSCYALLQSGLPFDLVQKQRGQVKNILPKKVESLLLSVDSAVSSPMFDSYSGVHVVRPETILTKEEMEVERRALEENKARKNTPPAKKSKKHEQKKREKPPVVVKVPIISLKPERVL